MPFLHLLRHAKSSRKKGVEDFARPLTRRGIDAARHIGEGLPSLIGTLDLVLCSPARRARETMELVVAGFAAPPRLLVENDIYLADQEKLLRRLCRLGEEEANVLLVAHNPGLRDLALALAQTCSPPFAALLSGKFPTAARASFEVRVPWPALGERRHPLLAYVTPRSPGGT
jgi:phosphohistidine phosphatase